MKNDIEKALKYNSNIFLKSSKKFLKFYNVYRFLNKHHRKVFRVFL